MDVIINRVMKEQKYIWNIMHIRFMGGGGLAAKKRFDCLRASNRTVLYHFIVFTFFLFHFICLFFS